MIITPDLSSAESVIAEFQGAQAGQPLVPGQIEFLLNGVVRVEGSYTGNPNGTLPNEKYCGWWYCLEPERMPFYTGPERMSMRYRMMVEADVPGNDAFNGGKWPGLIAPYDLWAESVMPPSPAPSAFATWEDRVFWGDYDEVTNSYGLGLYYYGVRAPRHFVDPTDPSKTTNVWYPGAVHDEALGVPSSIGMYFGNGTAGGVPMSNARIKVGEWTTFEVQVILNSVKDEALWIDTYYPNAQEALDLCLANANEDGVLRLLVNDVLAYEATKVAFRGLKKVRVQSGFVNIYSGGRGQYPKGPAHFQFADMSLSDEVQGGGTQPMPDLPTQEQKDAATANAHAAVDQLSALVVVGQPVPPPPAQTIDEFGATPPMLPAGGGEVVLDWVTSNSSEVRLDGEDVDDDGMVTLQQTVPTTYTLTAEGAAPMVTRSITVDVAAVPPDGDLPMPLPLPAPPLPTDSALGNLVVSMQPNTWAELAARFLGPVINSSSQSGCVIPYSNAAAWDEFNAEIAVVAADHLVQPRLCIYSMERNSWRARRWFEPTFVHAYQHTVCVGGVRYYRYGGELLADDGSRDWTPVAPMNVNISQVATVALVAWNGIIFLYDGNMGQFARYDPYNDLWLDPLTGMMPEMGGVYHVVAAVTPHGIVYGGGNGGNCPLNPDGTANNRQLWRLNSDLTKTRMPDAPIGHIGVFSGANIVPGPDGNVYALGFGQHWKLDPSGAGKWCRLPDPPTDLIDPASGQGFISCSVPGAIAYIDAGYGIPARMRIYKPA